MHDGKYVQHVYPQGSFELLWQYIGSMHVNVNVNVQAEVAPFSLENLGCTGSEARLVDCPVQKLRVDTVDYTYSFTDYDYSSLFFDACDPFAESYASVVCSNITAGGVHTNRPLYS